VNRPRAQLLISAVALILGFLVVLQIRAQGAGSELASRSAQELTVLVANLNDRNEQLRQEVATLEQELRDLEAARARGDSSLDELQRDLTRLRMWAGLDPVGGSGVRITVAGPLDGEGAMELVNELRNAGAEAIAVDGVRLVAASVVAGPAGGLSVEDQPLSDPFVVEGVGSPETLTGTLTRAGGVVALLGATYDGVTLTVTPVERMVLGASTRELRPAHGTPRL
jgi:uncharacterized protein YlxW (UPF0749 family)